ncbi:MAG TPA: hypothetical protein VGL13_00585, partial [Polyangiaceae bacterium]
RAWHLSRGDRFRIFGVMLLSSIATLSIWLTAFLFANWAFRSELTVQLFTEVFGLLALPVVHVTLVVVYFDNRVRKEGFDLALSAARLATGMPESVASSAPATL